MAALMSSSIKPITAISALFVLGLIGCRATFGPGPDTEDTDDTDDTDTSTWPEVAQGGGCPDDSWDLFDNSNSPHLGGEEEILIEVNISTDFHCPFCMSFAMELMEYYQQEKYRRYVRLYYHHFPLEQHVDVWEIHYAVLAVFNQSMEKFWMLHDEIYLREFQDERMTIEELVEYADTVLKLDMDQFNSDRASDETMDFIQYEIDQARDFGLTGTPTLWVCGNKSSWGDLDELVDYYLEGVE